MAKGSCHCGKIQYEVSGEMHHSALCHCSDCRKSSGAPMVGWVAFDADKLKVNEGKPLEYASSEHGRRHFCGNCGTGLFYYNEAFLPGIVDIQTATLNEAEDFAPGAHIQTAERLGWMENAHTLPAFERFPSQ